MTPYEIIKIALKNNAFHNFQIFCLIRIAIESFLSIYKGFAAILFIRSFLGAKETKMRRLFIDIAFSAVYAAVLTVEYFFCGLFKNEWFFLSAIPLTLILVAYAFLRCKGKTSAKISVSAVANAVIILITVFSNLMTVELSGKMSEHMLDYTDIAVEWSVLFISPVLIYFAFYVILRLFHKTDISGKKSLVQWTIVSVTLLISIVFAFNLFIRYAFDLRNHVRLTMLAGTVIASFILSDIFVFFLISDILKKNKAINELNLVKQTEEYNRQYINHLQSEYETVKKLRHDSKNSLLTLSLLLNSGDIKKAKEQIDENLDALNESEVFINTNNSVVNAIVNAKLTAAKSAGIECECVVCKDICKISDSDLCRLISNMLDNALTACINDPSPKRRIEFRIIHDADGYVFTAKNTVARSVLESNPKLESTKENPSEHGFGVKIIREIAEKYDGRSDFYEEDGMFCCSVCLR